MTNKDLSAPRKILKWLNGYADDLANLCGGLFVLGLGGLVFVAGAFALERWSAEYAIRDPEAWLIGLAAAAAAVFVSFFLMVYFARRDHELDRDDESEVLYVVTKESIDTLAAARVGADIIVFLRRALRESGETHLAMSLLAPEDADHWYARLRRAVGETRLTEFDATILKYTMRKKTDFAPPAPEARPTPAAAPANDAVERTARSAALETQKA